VLLGPAPLLVQRGLTGRFELIRVPRWSFAEMRTGSGWDLDRYIYHGGYPGAATLVSDREWWVHPLSCVRTTSDVLLPR